MSPENKNVCPEIQSQVDSHYWTVQCIKDLFRFISGRTSSSVFVYGKNFCRDISSYNYNSRNDVLCQKEKERNYQTSSNDCYFIETYSNTREDWTSSVGTDSSQNRLVTRSRMDNVSRLEQPDVLTSFHTLIYNLFPDYKVDFNYETKKNCDQERKVVLRGENKDPQDCLRLKREDPDQFNGSRLLYYRL